MKESDRALPLGPAAKRNSNALTSWLKGGALSAVLIAAVVIISSQASSSQWWPGHAGGDEVSQSEQSNRLNAFLAMSPLPLRVVEGAQLEDAVNSMNLTPADQSRALGAYKQDRDLPPDPAKPGATPQPTTHQVAQGKPAPLAATPRLAWVTLWDSDVEDGDAVRIESEGYGRTVVLKKQPVTFAIPIPSGGTILIKGVRDGDGGGITVGLASGDAKVLLPVMSVDQTIALRVGSPQ